MAISEALSSGDDRIMFENGIMAVNPLAQEELEARYNYSLDGVIGKDLLSQDQKNEVYFHTGHMSDLTALLNYESSNPDETRSKYLKGEHPPEPGSEEYMLGLATIGRTVISGRYNQFGDIMYSEDLVYLLPNGDLAVSGFLRRRSYPTVEELVKESKGFDHGRDHWVTSYYRAPHNINRPKSMLRSENYQLIKDMVDRVEDPEKREFYDSKRMTGF